MCANFRHQGGQGAVTRILAKTAKPYTLESLYKACQSDTGNQVGAYKARQRFVYKALKEHFPEGDDYYDKDRKATQWMENLARDDSHGYDQDSRWGVDYDCSSAVIKQHGKLPGCRLKPREQLTLAICTMSLFLADLRT